METYTTLERPCSAATIAMQLAVELVWGEKACDMDSLFESCSGSHGAQVLLWTLQHLLPWHRCSG